MSNYNKVVVTTPTYSVTDMAEGSTPICDTKILSGSSWNFNSEELPATVYYESTSVSKPKTYVFASDSHHVEMSTNRTLEEEYTSLLGKFGKEIDSPDGSAIQVNDGISGKVLKMSIKGQTVKNVLPTEQAISLIGNGTTFVNNYIPLSSVALNINSKYTLFVFVSENTFTNAFIASHLSLGAFTTECSIPSRATGVFRFPLTSKPSFEGISTAIRSQVAQSNETGTIKFQRVLVEGDVSQLNSYIPFGLSSTQTIISNNGQQYPIYANEEDKANKKVILIGGVGDVYDTLELKEDGSVIYTQNTKNLVLNGSENWKLDNDGIKNLDTTAIFGNLPGSTDKVRVIGDMYKGDTWNNGWVNDNIVFMHPNGGLFIRDTSIATLEEFKAKLSTTNLIVRGSLGTPIVTHIPKELVPAILTHNQTNILGVGGAVKPSSFKVTVPVDRLAEIEARLQALESTTVDVVLNK